MLSVVAVIVYFSNSNGGLMTKCFILLESMKYATNQELSIALQEERLYNNVFDMGTMGIMCNP